MSHKDELTVLIFKLSKQEFAAGNTPFLTTEDVSHYRKLKDECDAIRAEIFKIIDGMDDFELGDGSGGAYEVVAAGTGIDTGEKDSKYIDMPASLQAMKIDNMENRNG